MPSRSVTETATYSNPTKGFGGHHLSVGGDHRERVEGLFLGLFGQDHGHGEHADHDHQQNHRGEHPVGAQAELCQYALAPGLLGPDSLRLYTGRRALPGESPERRVERRDHHAGAEAFGLGEQDR